MIQHCLQSSINITAGQRQYRNKGVLLSKSRIAKTVLFKLCIGSVLADRFAAVDAYNILSYINEHTCLFSFF